ncbi:hypothetical protein [Pontibacter mangrovi]|uniref:Uncharacterized protein n=1 Tax=Pontibacter mangrovi TaxID=2589816 RepID=A0A501WA36_9BACT|nr:hypothetical protein [Pontibacter mangrovi]TPE45335.1 hypothetical protein FJM65_04665 [Pontibacter mangrovi]
METNKENSKKQEKKPEKQQKQPRDWHSSEGHHASGEGTATSTHEASERAATTDSSREPKNPNDDLPTGGNVR